MDGGSEWSPTGRTACSRGLKTRDARAAERTLRATVARRCLIGRRRVTSRARLPGGIIRGAPSAVGQYRIRIVDECRRLVIAAKIGVMPQRGHQGAVGRLDDLEGRIRLDVQEAIVVAAIGRHAGGDAWRGIAATWASVPHWPGDGALRFEPQVSGYKQITAETKRIRTVSRERTTSHGRCRPLSCGASHESQPHMLLTKETRSRH